MKSIQGQSPKTVSSQVKKGLLAAAVLTGVTGLTHRAAIAQALLQQQGSLAPMEDAYEFDGELGQAMTIELKSEDFDTILLLKGPDGEILTSNDDFGGTLNSTIVLELPETGTYSAIASSFSGQGGNYQIEVRPASEYEQVFSRAYDLSVSEDFDDAIEAYTAAISLDDTAPGAYLGRAEATINRAYVTSTTDIAGPEDLPKSVIDAVVADYLKAADLLDQQGQTGPAASLREQAQYFTDGPNITTPSPEVAPDDMPMPVEPDAGIGDGATPLPEVIEPAEEVEIPEAPVAPQ
ncbi:MAG: hypothetical protein WA885_04055 [Phormidesmis sp.]